MEGDTTAKRVGFIIESGAPAREDAKIFSEDKQNIIGKVTSGTFSPCLRKPIGMAYVNSKYSKIGTNLNVVVRSKDYPIKIAKMPFVPTKYYKKKSE
jgi:aminomethyltransferase